VSVQTAVTRPAAPSTSPGTETAAASTPLMTIGRTRAPAPRGGDGRARRCPCRRSPSALPPGRARWATAPCPGVRSPAGVVARRATRAALEPMRPGGRRRRADARAPPSRHWTVAARPPEPDESTPAARKPPSCPAPSAAPEPPSTAARTRAAAARRGAAACRLRSARADPRTRSGLRRDARRDAGRRGPPRPSRDLRRAPPARPHGRRSPRAACRSRDGRRSGR
jgi:hypothetical protein